MSTRRNFIKKMIAGGIILPSANQLLSGQENIGLHPAKDNQLENIRLALIGKGKMGTADTNTALQIPGVKLVAVCDLYDARLQEAKQQWGEIDITKDYKEILNRPDIDAVIIATPDHWHQPISLEAMRAGKHIYCEKPVIHKLSEAKNLIETQRETKISFQPGSQGMASIGNKKARQLIMNGAIGKINFIDGQFTSPPGVLNYYPVPKDASERTIDWKRFIGNASYTNFNPQHFFYWRNWQNYSTGIAGDLYVHVLASLHYITDAIGPEKVYATGGIHYYTDGGRDTPDIMLAYLDYPDIENRGAFTVQLGANYVDGVSRKWGSLDFRIVGSEGTLDVGWDQVTLKTTKKIDLESLGTLYKTPNPIDTPFSYSPNEAIFKVSDADRGAHYNHFMDFFTSIRTKTSPVADVHFAVRSAVPALLSYESYLRGNPIYWDAVNIKELRK